MIGVLIALGTALVWAGSSTILKKLSREINSISINVVRLWVGTVILIAYIFLAGKSGAVIHSNLGAVLITAAAGILAMAAGDTISIKSLSYMDVSRSYPTSMCTFTVLTFIASVIFLHESYTWFNVLGTFLVVPGIYLVTRKNKAAAPDRNIIKGLLFALLAAVFWAAGAVFLKIGVENIDSLSAAAIRVPVAAVTLSAFMAGAKGKNWLKFSGINRRNLWLAVSAGVLTYFIGAVGYAAAMQSIGAGKTVLLTAAAPLFILPLSVIFLRERPPVLALAGVFISVAGICLVAL